MRCVGVSRPQCASLSDVCARRRTREGASSAALAGSPARMRLRPPPRRLPVNPGASSAALAGAPARLRQHVRSVLGVGWAHSLLVAAVPLDDDHTERIGLSTPCGNS